MGRLDGMEKYKKRKKNKRKKLTVENISIPIGYNLPHENFFVSWERIKSIKYSFLIEAFNSYHGKLQISLSNFSS